MDLSISISQRMKRLRRASEVCSSASKSFAEALGKADEEAAKEAYLNNTCLYTGELQRDSFAEEQADREMKKKV